jgi:hypothetical protein
MGVTINSIRYSMAKNNSFDNVSVRKADAVELAALYFIQSTPVYKSLNDDLIISRTTSSLLVVLHLCIIPWLSFPGLILNMVGIHECSRIAGNSNTDRFVVHLLRKMRILNFQSSFLVSCATDSLFLKKIMDPSAVHVELLLTGTFMGWFLDL